MRDLKKRGQVSLFMIIGILIILALITVLYLLSHKLDVGENLQLPQDLWPAGNYIHSCMDQVSEEAFYLLGQQGGFVDVPLDIRANPGRRVSKGGALFVPFWYYENKNHVPTEMEMQDALEKYINSHFISCLYDYYPQNANFIITALSRNSSTAVSINENDITVKIDYPMEISNLAKDKNSIVKRFERIYDVKLKRMMALARYILDYENTYMPLENITIDLMAMNKDIPFTGMLPECGVRSWRISDVKKSLQLTLQSQLPNIRVEGTDYMPFDAPESSYMLRKADSALMMSEIENEPLFTDSNIFIDHYDDYEKRINAIFKKYEDLGAKSPNDSYYYYHMLIPLLDPKLNSVNFSADFEYDPLFGLDIQAKPSSNGILKSNSINGIQKYLSFFCLNFYHFTYDVNYPVIVTLTDPEALATSGFKMRFAIPVMIRSNEGMKSKQSFDFIKDYDTPKDYCISGQSSRKSIIKVYDDESSKLLDGVNISMLCVKNKCLLGNTSLHAGGIFLRANLTESCSRPYLIAEKQGYFKSYKMIEDDRTDLIEMSMVKLKNLTVDLQKHMIGLNDNALSNGVPITSGEVIISIEGLVDDALYQNSYVLDAKKENSIELPSRDASYDLSITYLKNSEDYSGGYYSEWKVTKDTLAASSHITFHVAEVMASALDEDNAKSVGMIDSLNSTQLRPEFK